MPRSGWRPRSPSLEGDACRVEALREGGSSAPASPSPSHSLEGERLASRGRTATQGGTYPRDVYLWGGCGDGIEDVLEQNPGESAAAQRASHIGRSTVCLAQQAPTAGGSPAASAALGVGADQRAQDAQAFVTDDFGRW